MMLISQWLEVMNGEDQRQSDLKALMASFIWFASLNRHFPALHTHDSSPLHLSSLFQPEPL
jgi:hypothetical protein